jgi:hypothetical protein
MRIGASDDYPETGVVEVIVVVVVVMVVSPEGKVVVSVTGVISVVVILPGQTVTV